MARIGSMACPAPKCGNQDATVSQTPAKAVNVSCHRCEFSGYGKAGTKASRLILAATKLDDDAAPPAPAPAPGAPAPSPAPRKPAGTLMG